VKKNKKTEIEIEIEIEANNTETTRCINNDSLEIFVERSESLTPNSFNIEWLIDRLVEEK
jgi:hypothetical protein